MSYAKAFVFETEDAIKYGVDCAILLYHIRFWIHKNQTNNVNYFDGHYWTFNAKKSWKEQFPFWTESQIRRMLDKLIQLGVLITGRYGSDNRDRTLWYSLEEPRNSHLSKSTDACVEIDRCMCQNRQMHRTNSTNASDEFDQCIIRTDIITTDIITEDNISTSANAKAFEEFWDVYQPVKIEGRMVAKGSKAIAKKKFMISLQRGAKAEDIIAGAKSYLNYCCKNRLLSCGVAVFLNQERWKDLYETKDEEILI